MTSYNVRFSPCLGFIDMPELITYMQINYSQWKKFEEQGIHTLAEVKAKQMSLMNKKSALK